MVPNEGHLPIPVCAELDTIVCMIRLTTEQSKELRREEPPRIVADGEEFVLVRSDVFERIKGLIDEEASPNDFAKPEPEEIDESLYEAEDLG